jgi:hypothetical protein
MAQIILSGDGMTIELEDEIARNDELLKRALSPHYPDLANALISREQKEGLLKVTVSKRAGPKGAFQDAGSTTQSHNEVIATLEEAPDYLNPALALAWQLSSKGAFGSPTLGSNLPLGEQLALQSQISEAILEGEVEVAFVQKSLELLKLAPTMPSLVLAKGF